MKQHRERDAIDRAVRDFAEDWPGVTLEITRKAWPADGIVYARLQCNGAEEWTLLMQDCDYETARACLTQSAVRLAVRGDSNGF